ncbi:MAG: PPOX class F420-dependent enzyme [Pseudonocardiales bacterium]|nr:MAG: PPOX class F420-dependent enzyme [Pseudonocardiales bacterium]
MARPMSDDERRTFLLSGTLTAVLGTVRKDGRPHGAPVWFTLDGDDVIFTTGAGTMKGRNLLRDPRAAFTVDSGTPPFDFVTIEGRAELSEDMDEVLRWATVLGERYMGAERAEAFGKRNAVPGELLVRLRPEKFVALAEIAD